MKAIKIILTVVLLAALPGCSAMNDVQRMFVSPQPFDEKVWKDLNQRKARPGMARDLVAKKALDGKTREEMRAMLGHEKTKASTDTFARYEVELFEEKFREIFTLRGRSI